MSLVSVVIPVHNAERFLGECLDSVLGQTLQDIEIICVDDASTDGSWNVLSSYAARDGRMRVVAGTSKGAAAARNQGLDLSTGDYIFFCDADDWIDHETLAGMHAAAVKGEADAAVTGMRYFDSDTGKEYRVRNVGQSARDLNGAFAPVQLGDSLFSALRAQTGGKMFRLAFIRSLGLEFQNQPRANDIAFMATALAASKRIVVDGKSHYHYRKNHGGNLSSKVNQMPEMSAMAWLRAREKMSALGILEEFRRPLGMAASQALVEVMRTISDAAVARRFYCRIRGEFIPQLELTSDSSVSAAGVFFREEDPMAFYMEELSMARTRHAALNSKLEAWRRNPFAMLLGKLRGSHR